MAPHGMAPHGMLPPGMQAPPMPPMSRDSAMASMGMGIFGGSQSMSHTGMLSGGLGPSSLNPSVHHSPYPPSLGLPSSVTDLTSSVLSNSCWLPNPHDDNNLWPWPQNLKFIWPQAIKNFSDKTLSKTTSIFVKNFTI